MSIRTILVPLGGGLGDRSALDAAVQVARPLGGHITALHVEIDPDEAMVGLPATGFYLSDSFCAELEQANVAGETVPRRVFEQWRAQHHLALVEGPGYVHSGSAAFVVDHGIDALRARALTADLVVCPLFSPEQGGPPAAFETALIDAGRPVLAVPGPDGPVRNLEGVITVAWSASREGFQALTAALPLIRGAREVVVLHAGDWQIADLQPIMDYLAWHGVSARGDVLPGGENPGQTLLDEAKRLGTDLLVMGGYTHSRTRERLFGGVTQHMLHRSDIPLLLSH